MTSNKKANQEVMQSLHALVAKKIKEKLDSPDCTAQDIAQAIKFLKDNGVAADPEFSDELKQIEEAMVDIKSLPFPVKASEQ